MSSTKGRAKQTSKRNAADPMELDSTPTLAASSFQKSVEAIAQKQTESLPWTEKYRPKNLSDLISHGEIISTISKLIKENKLPHLLFYGPPGTGKTSTILACARQLYGSSYQSMILELNASDDRGIDVVRQQIKDFASSRKLFSSGVKLVVLDEADAMTPAAQAALRRVIEKYTSNTRFCIICNYIGKILPAIQSRCTRFRFAPLHRTAVRERLDYVATTESLKITPDGMDAVVRLGGGDMRRCLNILQTTSMGFDEINEKNVYLCTGNPLPQDIEQILVWLLNEDFHIAYRNTKELKMIKGLALQDILKELQGYIFRIDFGNRERITLIEEMATLEQRLSIGANEAIQLGALVAAFSIAKDSIVEQASPINGQ